MTPSRESSRKSGLSRSQRSPSRQPGSATAAHPARVPPALHQRGPSTRPQAAKPSPSPTPAAPPEGLRHRQSPALTPPEPNSSHRPDSPQPSPAPVVPARSSAPRPGPSPHYPPLPPVKGPDDLGGGRAQPGARARSPSFPQPTHTPRCRRHQTLPPQPWPRPFPPRPETGSTCRAPTPLPTPNRTQAPATPPTAVFAPPPSRGSEAQDWRRGSWRLGGDASGAPTGGAGPWRESPGPLLWPARSSYVSVVWGRGGAQPWGENGVGLAAPGLRLPPLLRLLPFPSTRPWEGVGGGVTVGFSQAAERTDAPGAPGRGATRRGGGGGGGGGGEEETPSLLTPPLPPPPRL